jgi:general secretion pathway protein H
MRGTRAGFTLLEMLVVLVILGLALGIVVSRGPMRSQRLDMDAAARSIAGTLRLARSRAIVRDQTVRVAVDVAAHRYAMDGEAPHALPADVELRVVTVAGLSDRARVAAIAFAPDGSSSGGRIELVGRGRTVQVGVDWLTGRVSLADAR